MRGREANSRRFLKPLLLPLALALAACRQPEPPPIVLVSIDTLRSDRLNAYGYDGVETPAIDRLRRDGMLFEQAYVHVPLTRPSHASMLTGLLPPAHGVRDNLGYQLAPDGPATLGERLRARGYASGASVSSQVLSRRTGMDRGFDFWSEPELVRTAIEETVERPGGVAWRALAGWLDSVPRARPVFLFFHLYEPHYDWIPPEPFLSRYGKTYEGEIAAADAAVGEALTDLDRRGLYDRAVIVLTSDHGEGLGDHGELEHGALLYREALQVPLILKLPGGRRAGERVAEPVETIDLAPTLLALAGAEAGDLPGRDLTAKTLPPRILYAETYYPQLHFGWSELRSAISGSWHFIAGPTDELFHLADDPAETQDLLADERRAAAPLRSFLDGIDPRLTPPDEVDEETAKALGALGYLGSAATVSEGPRPHPKDKVREMAALLRGMQLLRERKFAEAEALLRQAIALEPKMSYAWNALGTALDGLGRKEEAAEAMAKAASLSPVSGKLALGAALRMLGVQRPKSALEFVRGEIARGHDDAALRVVESRALMQLGRPDEARVAIDRALALDPRNADAHYQLGVLGMTARRADLAGPALERAIALDPNHVAAKKALATLEYALGRPERARTLLQEVLALSPDDPDAREGLALLDQHRGAGR